jgi:4-hydroxy-3-methylbut-2-en-1-yl diphosphate synthase IspG/GcpE
MKQTDGSKVRVMIRCSITGDTIETGLMADPQSWNARSIGLNRVACPACKQSHAWSKKDAFLEASPGV